MVLVSFKTLKWGYTKKCSKHFTVGKKDLSRVSKFMSHIGTCSELLFSSGEMLHSMQQNHDFASMKPDTKNRINSPLFQRVGREECYFSYRGSCTTHAAPRSAGIDHQRIQWLFSLGGLSGKSNETFLRMVHCKLCILTNWRSSGQTLKVWS